MPANPCYPVLLDGGDLDGYEVEIPFSLGLCSPFIAVPLPPPAGLLARVKWQLSAKEYRTYKLQCEGRTPGGEYPLPRQGPRFPGSWWKGEGRYLIFEPSSGAGERVKSPPRPARVKLPHQVKSVPTPRGRLSGLAERLGRPTGQVA